MGTNSVPHLYRYSTGMTRRLHNIILLYHIYYSIKYNNVTQHFTQRNGVLIACVYVCIPGSGWDKMGGCPVVSDRPYPSTECCMT